MRRAIQIGLDDGRLPADGAAAADREWLLPARLPPFAAQAILISVFLVAYIALEWVSFIHEYEDLPITPWNPGLGVVFALIVRHGARYGIVLFVGALVAEVLVLHTRLPWPLLVAGSAVIAGGYSAIAHIARRRFRLDATLEHLRDILVLLVTGACGAVLVAVVLGVLLPLDTRLEVPDVVAASIPLLVGDLIGIAVMTPLMLRIVFMDPFSPIRRWRILLPEAAIYVALVAAILWMAVGAGLDNGFKLFYLLFLPVVITAVRHGIDGACIGLALTQFGLVLLLHLHGFDVHVFTDFQVLMLVLTATGLIVGVVVSERRNMDRITRAAEARLKEKEAEAAQAARFNLVSSMASALAHEINQPMTAARALARAAQQIVRGGGEDLARADANLTKMIDEIDHAANVVGRVREFLRRGEPHVSTIDVGDLVGDALKLVRGQAAEAGIAIDLDLPDGLPVLHGDNVQLQQVLLNLVHNAVDAITGAGQGGRVRVSARRLEDPARVEFRVADDGPGMSDQEAARLFQPLATSKPDGLGLGLSICASIVELHGGRIWLQSHEPGITEFRFSVPFETTATE